MPYIENTKYDRICISLKTKTDWQKKWETARTCTHVLNGVLLDIFGISAVSRRLKVAQIWTWYKILYKFVPS